MSILKPESLKARIKEPHLQTLERLALDFTRLGNSKLGGQELFYALEALGLDDPESDLCELVGYDNVGATLCRDCPLGPTPAGCMTIYQPIMRQALKGKSARARLGLLRLSNIITTAISMFQADKKHAPN